MPYSGELAERLSRLLAGRSDLEPRKMFGGICFMRNGNVALGIYKDFLIVRVGEQNALNLLKKPFARPMDITGKPMKGWVMVSRDGWDDDEQLNQFVGTAIKFVSTLPAK